MSASSLAMEDQLVADVQKTGRWIVGVGTVLIVMVLTSLWRGQAFGWLWLLPGLILILLNMLLLTQQHLLAKVRAFNVQVLAAKVAKKRHIPVEDALDSLGAVTEQEVNAMTWIFRTEIAILAVALIIVLTLAVTSVLLGHEARWRYLVPEGVLLASLHLLLSVQHARLAAVRYACEIRERPRLVFTLEHQLEQQTRARPIVDASRSTLLFRAAAHESSAARGDRPAVLRHYGWTLRRGSGWRRCRLGKLGPQPVTRPLPGC